MNKYEEAELPENNGKKCKKYGKELNDNLDKEEKNLFDLFEKKII